MPTAKESNRLTTLDYLRGFFIVVIITDHLSRWPSLLGIFSGQALLWITAAEGFVIISGLLVGYVRGYKNRTLPMWEVIKKVESRAVLLYVWSIIATVAYTAIIWYVPLVGGAPGMPVDKGNWGELIEDALSLNYTYVWVHFLTYYALFLAASPIAIWLLRKSKAWMVIVISLIVLAIGWAIRNEAMQWQAVFFIPSVAGYYLESIRRKWQNLEAHTRVTITTTIWTITALTITSSVIFSFYNTGFTDVANYVNNVLFAKDSISLLRLLLAFLWFAGFLLLFERFTKWIGRFLGWLLLPIGTRSLTAYILHGVALVLISLVTVAGGDIVINTVLGVCAIMIVWLLLRLPIVEKYIPR